jgi:L-iditol 2-dehydrogenase
MNGLRVVWPEQGKAGIEPFNIPRIGAGEVLIRTETTLVSPGTERAHLLGMPNTPNQFPMYPGYSNVGRIVACGPGVTRFRPGDRVLSYSPHASHVIAPEHHVVPIPVDLHTRAAAFGSLASIALQGVRKSSIELGTCVAVMGAGLIGLFAAQLARAAGASDVVVIDPMNERRRLAALLGTSAVVGSWQAPELTGQYFPSVVIDATGSNESIVGALEICRPQGAVVILGSPRGTANNVNLYSTVHLKGLRLIGGHDYIRPRFESTQGYWTWVDDARLVMNLMVDGRVRTEEIPRNHWDVDDIEELYTDLVAGSCKLANFIDWPSSS